MISLFDVFRMGIGPSSSYIVGPMKAGKQFVGDPAEKGLLDSVIRIAVDTYGSLSLTSEGHHTDIVIIMDPAGNESVTVGIDSIPGFIHDVEECEHLLLAQRRHEVDFPRDNGMRFHSGNPPLHENGMRIRTYSGDEVVYSKTYYSIGNGFIVDEEYFGQDAANEASISCSLRSVTEFLIYCNETGYSLSGLVMQNGLTLHSKEETNEYFVRVQQAMQACIDRGMNTEGILPGPLCVPRRASVLRRMLVSSDKLPNDLMSVIDQISMFTPVVNEENAIGDRVVTTPTNGACGIVPAVLTYYDHFIEPVSSDICTRYFMAAGTIGALYKINTSIFGAEVGCQGEVGVACSTAAAGLVRLLGGSPEWACVAAGIGMEHNLGLIYDPVTGQAQVPCIERNAIIPAKAISTARMALRRISTPYVSLDKAIRAIYEVGKDMDAKCRETSRGGLTTKIQCDQYSILAHLQRMDELILAFSSAVISPTTLPLLYQALVAIHLQGGPHAKNTTDH